MKTNLKQLSEQELSLLMERLGQKPFRRDQVINWIYKKLAASINEMTDLSKAFRKELNTMAIIGNLNLLKRQVSDDGTEKFLFELEDAETVESVLIPNNREAGCFTLCISSQVGCAMGCRFCLTGKLGLKRNLRAYEIADQVIAVSRQIAQTPPLHPLTDPGNDKKRDDAEITNIVFMGMGEPFNNFNEVAHALQKITGLIGFSKRKITLSTAGIIPGIRKLADTGPIVNLAISLNATDDETRSRVMPINKKYPLNELIRACREFPLPLNRRITFEYVLLGGINDSTKDAHRLVGLLKGIRSKVNLIPYNPPHDATEFRAPSRDDMMAFQGIIRDTGLTVIIRKSKGADISAACGQLRASYDSSSYF